MNRLLGPVSELCKKLDKHPDVLSVFRYTSDKEVDEHYKIINRLNNKDYQKMLNSFRTNLVMLRDISIDREEENKSTVDVMDAAVNCLSFLENISREIDYKLTAQATKMLFIQTAAMLVMFCVNCQVTRKISSLLDTDLNYLRPTGEKYIFRGHSNKSYKLIPSIYRNISIENGLDYITEEKLKSLYAKSNLVQKYKDVFGTSKLDYNFFAFAQHSKAYSPFLDFTDNIHVALSFAIGNTTSVNDYFKREAALFCLSTSRLIENKENISFDKIDIFICEKKVTPFSTIRNKRLFLCTYRDFDVDAFVIKDKTNDRMKYQKGCFLYFQRAVIINGNLLFPLSFGRIKKYTIPTIGNTLTKTLIYEKIRNNHIYYLPEYLMNPYKYFEEAPL